jgi:5'-nucleotidase
MVADAVRIQAAADVAIVNAGGIRGDRLHPPGPLTRRALVALHPFGNVVCKLEVPGAVLLEALEHGVSRLPAAAGQFPQVSGLTFRVDAGAAPGSRVRDVRVQGAPIDPARRYTLAIPDFLLLGGDGYAMFKGQDVLVAPESGITMVNALEEYIAARREVAPAIEGRIIIGAQGAQGAQGLGLMFAFSARRFSRNILKWWSAV